MFEFIFDSISDRVAGAVKRGLSPAAPYLRMLGTGLLVVLISIVFWAIGGLFLSLSFFLLLAHLPYALAALYVFLAADFLGLCMLVIGLRMLRKPR